MCMSGLFSTKQNQKSTSNPLFSAKTPAPAINRELESKISSANRRMITIEDRYRNLRKQRQFNERDSLQARKKMEQEIHALDQEISDLHKDIDGMSQRIDMLSREIEGCGKQEDLAVLEKYLELWEPVSFLTVDEAKKMIEEAVAKIKNDTFK